MDSSSFVGPNSRHDESILGLSYASSTVYDGRTDITLIADAGFQPQTRFSVNGMDDASSKLTILPAPVTSTIIYQNAR